VQGDRTEDEQGDEKTPEGDGDPHRGVAARLRSGSASLAEASCARFCSAWLLLGNLWVELRLDWEGSGGGKQRVGPWRKAAIFREEEPLRVEMFRDEVHVALGGLFQRTRPIEFELLNQDAWLSPGYVRTMCHVG